MSYNPRAKLSDELESWLSLGMNGYQFAERAASELLRNCTIKHDAAYYMLISALSRKDKEAVRIYINDWSRKPGKQYVVVSKFIPGEHYHCDGTKFDSLELAQKYISDKGWIYAGLKEQYVYNTCGD